MKIYSTGLEIKKKLINALKEKPTSLRKLETKLNLGYNSIKLHIIELEYLGIVKVTKTKENSRNGRSYLISELTDYGRKLKF